MSKYIYIIPAFFPFLFCFASRATEQVPADVLGLSVSLRAKESPEHKPRVLPKGQAVAFSLKDTPAGAYRLAVEVLSADETGEDGKHILGGFNYLLPRPSYTMSLNGKDIPMNLSCRSPIRLEDDPRTKKPVYVGWMISRGFLDLKPGSRLTIQCKKHGGFVRRITLLDDTMWEAEKIRSSDLPPARSDMGWGPTLFTRPPYTRWYEIKRLDDTIKAMEYFSDGFAKPYLKENPYASLIEEGKTFRGKVQTYRDASANKAFAIDEGANLAKQWQDYYANVNKTLHKTIPPVLESLRTKLDFEKSGIKLNESCWPGREAMYSRDVAREYINGAEKELQQLNDPNDHRKRHILNLITFTDNAAEFAENALGEASKPQTTVEFPDYFVAAQKDDPTPILPATKAPRGEICLNGVWDFAINKGPDNPPKPNEWPREQQVPHGEWGFSINKAGIPVEKWLKQSRAYWEWYETNVWYHTEFDVPSDWTERRMVIAFEEVVSYIEIFVNGRYAGLHRTGLIPFEIDVTKHLVPGARNNILVYVVNDTKTARPGSHYRYQTRPNLHPTRTEEGYFGGINGDVYLRATPKTRIAETYVRTWADKRIRVETTVRNDTDKPVDSSVTNVIRQAGKDLFSLPPQKIHLQPGEEKTVVTEATWPEAKLWGVGGQFGSPENLYYLVSRIGEIDTSYTEFGFRELTIQEPNFYLNGIRFPLQGDNFTAVKRYPERRCHWYIYQLFRLNREANINFTRAHQSCVFPDHAEIANRIGILLEPEGPWWTLNPPSDIIDQRNTAERPHGQWSPYENRSYDDPVWRKNCRAYYREIVKRYRNNPSVAIFSTENECLAGENADTIYQFNQWIKQVAPHLIVDCHSNCSVWDDRFEIANFHDYDVYVARMLEWAEASGPNHKPVIIGEFYNYSLPKVVFHSPPGQAKAAEWAMAKWVERRFAEYIEKLNAGPMYFTFEDNSGALWCNASPETDGPWADRDGTKDYNGVIYPDWPSTSGRGGFKVERFLTSPNVTAINFCDPARIAATTTKVFDAFQKAYKEIPGWSNRRQPELIVTVLQSGKPVPGVNVFLVPKDNQATEPVGVEADAEGKAWFIARESGKYAVQVGYNGKVADNEVTLDTTEIENRGGFDYIPRATIDLDHPDKMTVALPENTPLIRPKASQAAKSLPPVPNLQQGTESVSAEGFIRDWLVCGPFPGGGRDVEDQTLGWNVDSLAPTGGELQTTPKPGTTYPAEFQETQYAYWEPAKIDVAWRRYVSPEDFVDLGKVFQRNDVKGLDFAPVQFVVGYAACTIDSPTERDAIISLGSDDGYKLYLNHERIKADRVYRGAKKDEDKIPVHLKKGKNLLMLKVEQDVGGYGFFLRLLEDQPLRLPIVHETSRTKLQKDGWIRDWLLCGPFANPGRGLNEKTWAFDYLASDGGEAKIQPAAGMKYVAEFAEDSTVSWTPGKADISWREAEARKDGFVNLSEEFVTKQIQGLDFPPVENVLGYAAVYVYCDQPTRGRLEIDTDNGVKVRLNQKQIFDKHVHRYNTDPASPNKMIFEEGNYYQNVELKQGVNVLLLKLDVAGGPFRFRCRFIDEKGESIPNLHVGTEAPENRTPEGIKNEKS
ncbi:MAG: beta-galactosidase [Phycisphaerae bacterium]|nr:beta-galactosidase [Phycisphaerae bacterium]